MKFQEISSKITALGEPFKSLFLLLLLRSLLLIKLGQMEGEISFFALLTAY
jgi:hypothetical protein